MDKENEQPGVVDANQHSGWTRRDFFKYSALFGAKIAIGGMLAGCATLFSQPASQTKPPESAKKKENLVTSAEVWWGSSTIYDAGIYLYNEAVSDTNRTKFDDQRLDNHIDSGRNPYNFGAIFEKSGHATFTHGHYFTKVDHFIGEIDNPGTSYPVEPGVLNLFIGGNEMADLDDLSGTLNNVRRLVSKIHSKYTNARINLVNLFEVVFFKPNSAEPDTEKKEMTEKWRFAYNAGLDSIARENSSFISSIPTDSVVQTSGLFNPALLRNDGRHLGNIAMKRFIAKVRGLPPPSETGMKKFYGL